MMYRRVASIMWVDPRLHLAPAPQRSVPQVDDDGVLSPFHEEHRDPQQFGADRRGGVGRAVSTIG